MAPPYGNQLLGALHPPAAQLPTGTQGSQPRHPNDAVVAHIKQRMGNDAALLAYLAVDMIRIEPLAEENRPETARPYQMYVGKFPQDRDEAPAKHVRILLHIGQADGTPDIRYHIFADDGHSLGLIKAKDAFAEAEICPPFSSLIESGEITESKVRAMVRYCFLVKRAHLKNMWTINDQFIKDLIAACKTAQANSASSKLVSQPIRRGLSDQERDLRNRPASYEEFWLQSVSNVNNRGERSRKKSMKGSIGQGKHAKHPTDAPNPGGKPRQTTRTPKEPAYRRGVTPNRIVTSVHGANGESTAPTSHKTDQPTSQTVIAEEKRGESADQSSHDIGINDPQSFIATYTQLLDDDDRCNDELEKIMDEQSLVTDDIERNQKRLAELRNDEERIRNERKRGKDKQDNLHHRLSDGERALLAYGIELGSRSNKRAKTAEEHADDEIAGGWT